MPRLAAAEEFLAEEEALELPVGDKVYKVPGIDAHRWLVLMALDAVGAAQLTGRQAGAEDVALIRDMGQRDVLRVALGNVVDEMIADDVDPRIIEAASRAAAAFHRYGTDRAELVWRHSLGNPRAPLPGNRQQRRHPPTSPTSPSTDEASTTR